MKSNTAVELAQSFLLKGVHLREIQRFLDANEGIDPTADTVPAPPPSRDGSVDPDEIPTIPAPKVPSTLILPMGDDEFWDELAGLVECSS